MFESQAAKTILIDTNILLDCAITERPGRIAAQFLFDEIAYGGLKGLVSSLSLKDVYYVLAKYTNEVEAREFVSSLMQFVRVVSVDEAICRTAVESNEPDFEDGLIRACAEREKVDFIISRNEGAYARSPIKRLSAQDYVDLFCPVEEVELSPAPGSEG